MASFDKIESPPYLDGEANRSRHALPATLAVGFMLATSKWGSYIGVPPLFLTDVLIGLAAFHLLATWMLRPLGRKKIDLRALTWVIVLLVWSGVRFVAGTDLGITPIRDFAPYAYSVLAIISAIGYQKSSQEDRKRTANVLWIALVFHTAWMAVARIIPSAVSAMPAINGIHLFHTRTDIDGAILGVTAAFGLYRWAKGNRSWSLVVALLSWAVIFLLPSRAALLGAALSGSLALFAIYAQRADKPGRIQKQLIALSIPLILMALLAFLPQTTVGARLLTTFDQSSMGQEVTGRGTAQAREEAWFLLSEYVASSDSRALVGVGFGPDFMLDSGALRALLGDGSETDESGVRSPHNYFLGTWARLGAIGLACVVIISALAVVKAVKLRRAYGSDELLMFAGLLVVGLLPPTFLGVVLESPFGAVPYYWSVGIVLYAGFTTRSRHARAR